MLTADDFKTKDDSSRFKSFQSVTKLSTGSKTSSKVLNKMAYAESMRDNLDLLLITRLNCL